ncbi:hypothetical protein NDU88_007174 [Pleurodeles waltl]|uniref:Uncharacterized protein n=1 Tax=Pleurodeles waltl TaxID=8319 RepID=A0AAV7WGL5_PLEWA|nr:hypothetical protein NDU88_007174 [Pleurodeles waltl]
MIAVGKQGHRTSAKKELWGVQKKEVLHRSVRRDGICTEELSAWGEQRTKSLLSAPVTSDAHDTQRLLSVPVTSDAHNTQRLLSAPVTSDAHDTQSLLSAPVNSDAHDTQRLLSAPMTSDAHDTQLFFALL